MPIIPVPSSGKTTSVRLRPDLEARLALAVKARGMNRSSAINLAVANLLELWNA